MRLSSFPRLSPLACRSGSCGGLSARLPIKSPKMIAPSRSGGRDALIEALNLAPDFLENLVSNKHPDTRAAEGDAGLANVSETELIDYG